MAVGAASAAVAQTPASAMAAGRAAQVNGVTITAAEVDAKLGINLARRARIEIFALRQKQLDGVDATSACSDEEAAKRGVTAAALVQSEITSTGGAGDRRRDRRGSTRRTRRGCRAI